MRASRRRRAPIALRPRAQARRATACLAVKVVWRRQSWRRTPQHVASGGAGGRTRDSCRPRRVRCDAQGRGVVQQAALERVTLGMKDMTKFRILERPGSIIGMANLDTGTALQPFRSRSRATRLCHMFAVHRRWLLAASRRMTTLDSQTLRAALSSNTSVTSSRC